MGCHGSKSKLTSKSFSSRTMSENRFDGRFYLSHVKVNPPVKPVIVPYDPTNSNTQYNVEINGVVFQVINGPEEWQSVRRESK